MENVIVSSVKENNGWLNVTDNNNREIGIKIESNPKISALLKAAKAGDTVSMDIGSKNGKHYGFDIKDKKPFGGGNKWEPKNQEVITALSCISSASTLYSLKKDSTSEQVLAAAEQFYQFAMSKNITKPTEAPKS